MTGSLPPTWPQRWWPGGLAWARWVLTLFGLSTTALLDQLLHQAGRPDLTLLDAGGSTRGWRW